MLYNIFLNFIKDTYIILIIANSLDISCIVVSYAIFVNEGYLHKFL